MSTTRRMVGLTILTVLMFSSVFPLVGMVLTAFKTPGIPTSGLSLPDVWHWENFATAWRVAEFPMLMKSSLLICLGTVPAGLLTCTMAGFALGYLKVPGHKVVYATFLAGLVLPFEAAIVALYDLVSDMHLLGTRWAIILPLIGLSAPFGVFWMRGHFEAVPAELSESARIDGASSARLFRSIHLPLALPALLLLALMQFMGSWNQYMLAILLVDDPTKRTMGGALGAFSGQYTDDVVLASAGAVLMMAPSLIVFAFMQKHFIRSFMAGAVKG